LTECGATLPKLEPLEDLVRASADIARNFGPVVN
jgi:hypothetical protein